jgi:hypothetical protein
VRLAEPAPAHRLDDVRETRLAAPGLAGLAAALRVAGLRVRRRQGVLDPLLAVGALQAESPVVDRADVEGLAPLRDRLPRDAPPVRNRKVSLTAHGLRQGAEHHQRAGSLPGLADRPRDRRVSQADDADLAANLAPDDFAVLKAGRAIGAEAEAEAIGVVHGDHIPVLLAF